jgi:hypothetical protein
MYLGNRCSSYDGIIRSVSERNKLGMMIRYKYFIQFFYNVVCAAYVVMYLNRLY